MREAINKFQKNIFILLLYSSAFFGIAIDLAGIESRTAFYAAFDAMILLLGLLSFSKMKGSLAYIFILFLACFILNFSYSEANFIGSLNGFREILVVVFAVIFFNKIFAEGNEDLAEDYMNIFKKFGYIFLVSQIPIAVFQYIQNGGPGDAVGGSFGAFGSGVLTMSVICMVYFLHLQTTKVSNIALLYVCLVPLLLNETKISFILIPMMVLFVRFDLKFKNLAMALGGAAVFLVLFSMYYTDQSGENDASSIFTEDFLSDYLMADIYMYDDIPRFTKIMLAWQMISEQTNTFLFGFEYGLFKGVNTLRDSDFAQTYGWLLTGTRPYLFYLLLQGGIMLVTAFFLLLAHVNNYFRSFNKLKGFLLILVLIILVYNDLFRTQTFLILFFFISYYANSKFYTPDPAANKNIA